MTPFEAYKIYVAVHAHFTNPSYDITKTGGKTRSNEMSFNRRNDASYFFMASKRYKTKQEWLDAIIASFLEDQMYVIDIVQDNNIYDEYCARRENMIRRYQQDLRSLLDITKKLDYIFIENYDTTDPIILTKLHHKEITYESAVLMNKVFRWVPKVKTRDTLLWPITKNKILKYSPFIRVDIDKYKDLTIKVIKNHI